MSSLTRATCLIRSSKVLAPSITFVMQYASLMMKISAANESNTLGSASPQLSYITLARRLKTICWSNNILVS